ncbi:unnamed protein product [Sympodiomycopsis kandeliae]
MPKAPSSTARTVRKSSSSSQSAPKASSSSSSHGPSFKSAAPSRGAGQSLAAELRAHDQTSKFGSISQPGRRDKRKNRRYDADSDDEAGPAAAAAGSSTGLMVTGGRAGGAGSSSGGGANGSQKYVDKRLTGKILKLAREQQDEIEQEEQEAEGLDRSNTAYRSASGVMPDDDEDDDEAGDGMADDGELSDDLGGMDDDEEQLEYEEIEMDPEDAALMERMRQERMQESGQEGGRRTLADLIMDKIEAAGGDSRNAEDDQEDDGMIGGMNPKIVEVYTKVGEFLSRYKSGALPKPFKILPSLPHWEMVLSLTSPQNWTPHATLAATRIFVSNLKAQQSQRFFEIVLREKFRDEIEDNKKTSYQIYEALKKGLYKPAAWFKGILFPLCESGILTLKEASILSSVLTKVSIPMLHSAAALLRLSEMKYSGPNSLFIRVLLDKKYALPYKVVDALVFHFLRFSEIGSGVEKLKDGSGLYRMPVLWHQSLLVFSQRYKQDLTPDQKLALLDLLRVQKHDGISPEIRRELTTGKARGEMLDEPLDEGDMSQDDDDVMSV